MQKTKPLQKLDDEKCGDKNENKPHISPGEISKTSSRSSVLVEKVNENLQALLKAFDAWLNRK